MRVSGKKVADGQTTALCATATFDLEMQNIVTRLFGTPLDDFGPPHPKPLSPAGRGEPMLPTCSCLAPLRKSVTMIFNPSYLQRCKTHGQHLSQLPAAGAITTTAALSKSNRVLAQSSKLSRLTPSIRVEYFPK